MAARPLAPARGGNAFAGNLVNAGNAPRSFSRGGNNRPAGQRVQGGAPSRGRGQGLQRPTAPTTGLGNTIPTRQYFGEGSGGMGNRNVSGGGACKGCGGNIVPTIDEFYKTSGDGPYCSKCWADCWVPHTMYGLANMPQCEMGYRWTDRQMQQIQALVEATKGEFGRRMGRMPMPEELDSVLQQMKVSENCPWCKTDVVFSPKASDFKIPGVNVGG